MPSLETNEASKFACHLDIVNNFIALLDYFFTIGLIESNLDLLSFLVIARNLHLFGQLLDHVAQTCTTLRPHASHSLFSVWDIFDKLRCGLFDCFLALSDLLLLCSLDLSFASLWWATPTSSIPSNYSHFL